MSVPLDPSDNWIDGISLPENFHEQFEIDTGSSFTSVDPNYLKDAYYHFQVAFYDYVGIETASGEEFSVPTFLVPHFRVGNCDLGTVEVLLGAQGVPNLLGRNVLDRFSHWHMDRKNKTFEFSCPTSQPVVQFWGQ